MALNSVIKDSTQKELSFNSFNEKFNSLLDLYNQVFSEFYRYRDSNPYLPDTIVYQKYNNVTINTEDKLIDIVEIDMNSAVDTVLKIFAPDIYNLWKISIPKTIINNKQEKHKHLMIFLRDEIFKDNQSEYSQFIHKLNIIQKLLTMLYVYSIYPIYEVLELKKDSVIILTEKRNNKKRNVFYDIETLRKLNRQFYISSKNFKEFKYSKYIRYDKTTILQLKYYNELILKGKHKYMGIVFKMFLLGELNYNDIVRELNKLELIFKNEYRFLELYKTEIFDILGSQEDDKLYDVYNDEYITWRRLINKPYSYFRDYPVSLLYEKFIIPFLSI